MTVVAVRRIAPRQAGMKGLAGALAFLCLVLCLLAIEQKQALAASTKIREDAVPAAGREHFVFGQTFAGRLKAPANAQIELRRIIPVTRGEPVKRSTLCGGDVPGLVALLHRRDRVDLMLFRAAARPGSEAPVADLCGVWRLRAR